MFLKGDTFLFAYITKVGDNLFSSFGFAIYTYFELDDYFTPSLFGVYLDLFSGDRRLSLFLVTQFTSFGFENLIILSAMPYTSLSLYLVMNSNSSVHNLDIYSSFLAAYTIAAPISDDFLSLKDSLIVTSKN